QQFGHNLAQQHKKALIFGTDGLYDPKSFTINGSYVSTFGPDITGIRADAPIAAAAKAKYGSFRTFRPPPFPATPPLHEAIAAAPTAAAAKAKHGSCGPFGPPPSAATHVIDEAIAAVCKSGQTPSRANVLAQIKKTNQPVTILGQPIKFDSNGDLVNGKFFLF